MKNLCGNVPKLVKTPIAQHKDVKKKKTKRRAADTMEIQKEKSIAYMKTKYYIYWNRHSGGNRCYRSDCDWSEKISRQEA